MGIILLIILMAVSAAYVLVDVMSLPYQWNGLLNFKPFNCKTCLSGWLSLPLWAYEGYPLLHIPFLVCLCMMAGILINNAFSKYL